MDLFLGHFYNSLPNTQVVFYTETGVTAATALPSFRPGNPALCGSCPL